MLLVFDVGNTNTSIGIFDESHLLKNWRIRTVKNVTRHPCLQSVCIGCYQSTGYNKDRYILCRPSAGVYFGLFL
ncbi:MAG: type III pantothenate kinase [Deltaproteobacteria bacterium]|nr:type III pantothenate kinase [Deltaproteobacteria bacterium]